jgi:hypothetical protein
MSSRCLYCLKPTDGTESEDHPVPQCLSNDVALPRGAVCSKCNSYLGQLDQELCNHEPLSDMIVRARMPGTDGRIRQEITPFLRVDMTNEPIKISIRKAEIRPSAHDTRALLVFPKSPKRDASKLSRALHRVALGVYAFNEPKAALDSRFDPVRRYVREPSGRHVRPYWSRTRPVFGPMREIERIVAERNRTHVTLYASDKENRLLVYLNFIAIEFVVSLDAVVPVEPFCHLDDLARSSGLPDIPIGESWVPKGARRPSSDA